MNLLYLLDVSESTMIVALLMIVVIMVYLGFKIKVVREGEQMVVERLGQYYTTWDAGFHFLFPFVDRIRSYTDIKGNVTNVIVKAEQVISYSSKTIHTKDNIGLTLDLSLSLEVFDAKKYIYASNDTGKLIESFISRTLYNIIIDMSLDSVLNGRSTIIKNMRLDMSEALEAYGVVLNHLEVLDINRK